jgi:hypothetical protein
MNEPQNLAKAGWKLFDGEHFHGLFLVLIYGRQVATSGNPKPSELFNEFTPLLRHWTYIIGPLLVPKMTQMAQMAQIR